MGQIYQHLEGTTSQSFQIGRGSGDKIIIANIPGTNKPEIKYNDTTDVWQYSNDGSTFMDFGVRETSNFSASNNISSPTNITGFNFANSTTRAFEALVSLEIYATSDLYEVCTLRGIQKSTGWSLSITRNGDDSLFNFSITNSGQIQYTNGNYSGFISSLIKFNSNILTI